jgi:hypothetical protein
LFIVLNYTVADYAVYESFTRSVGFEVDPSHGAGSTCVQQATVFDEQILYAAHANALSVIVIADHVTNNDIPTVIINFAEFGWLYMTFHMSVYTDINTITT